MLKPLRKSSSAITKLKGLHSDTAPVKGQSSDSLKHDITEISETEAVGQKESTNEEKKCKKCFTAFLSKWMN